MDPSDTDLPLVWVRGFEVHTQIADAVEGLVAAMEAEGFNLGGWGYRTAQEQINLRRSHCGTSEWDIWSKPSSTCRPPTARPGRSNHERGLAIDLTNNGRLITSRNCSVFQALQRLAPSFGLKNPPQRALALVCGRPLTFAGRLRAVPPKFRTSGSIVALNYRNFAARQPAHGGLAGYSVWVQTAWRFSMNALGHSAPSPRAALDAITSMASL